jgi:uncharacterized protein (TIGR00299 family) protein
MRLSVLENEDIMAVKALLVDPVAGASGDMLLAALLDLGASADWISERIRSGGLHNFRIHFKHEQASHALMCGRCDVEVLPEETHRHEHDHDHRHEHDHQHEHEHEHDDHDPGKPHTHHHHRGLNDILAIIESSDAPARARQRASAVFRRLGEAEAAVHGIPVDEVHFHEVGAVDSIVDVFGICLALEQLGVDEVYCSGFKVGHGTVRCAHGTMPVPAPATVKLLAGQVVTQLDIPTELTTPTAAAVLSTLGRGAWSELSFTLVGTGVGHGRKTFDSVPNIVRCMLVDVASTSQAAALGRDEVSVLQCEIDDQAPEITGALFEVLFAAGALDVSVTPAQMKKNRLGARIQVVAPPGEEKNLASCLFEHTSTIGVRVSRCERFRLERGPETVDTPWGPVACKRIERPTVIELAPEFESARAVAVDAGVSVRQVMDSARRWLPRQSPAAE